MAARDVHGALVSLLWGDTTIAVQYCRRGRGLLAGTEPDCDVVLPPLPGLTAWRAQLLAWRRGELLARIPARWQCRVAKGRVLEIRPPVAGAPIRLLVRLSYDRVRRRSANFAQVAALVATMCAIVSPPLLDLLRAGSPARLDPSFTLAPVLLHVQAEVFHPSPASPDTSIGAPLPADGEAIPERAWLDVLQGWSFSGIRADLWRLSNRLRFADLPDTATVDGRTAQSAQPSTVGTMLELQPGIGPRSSWIPTIELPSSLQTMTSACLRVRRGKDVANWVWLGGEVAQGQLVGNWPLGREAASEQEWDCLWRTLAGKPVQVAFLRSAVRFAVHRPGRPLTPLQPPQEEAQWGCSGFGCWMY